MFTRKSFRLVVAGLIACLSLVPSALAQRKKQIAVLNFDFATVDIGLAHRAYGGQENLARRVSDKLVTSLVGLGTCQVIERSQLEKVLHEQNLGREGRIDPSTAARIGRILGVDALILGSVSVFDLQGLPQDGRDTIWSPKDMQARLAVIFRVVDTTTAVVELSNEMIGTSANLRKKRSAGEKIATGVLKDILSGNQSRYPQVKDEHVRDVVQLAVDDVVGKIALEVDNYLSGARRSSVAEAAPANQLNGRVIEVNGPTIYIMGISKSAIRIGDRLFVRRSRASRDPVTNREVRFTEKIGEVEIVEIQDEVIVGSFAGSGQARVGDLITSSIGGTTRPPADPQPNRPALRRRP
jgi:curli biogenesis system outer membrane secretion channel CsgG